MLNEYWKWSFSTLDVIQISVMNEDHWVKRQSNADLSLQTTHSFRSPFYSLTIALKYLFIIVDRSGRISFNTLIFITPYMRFEILGLHFNGVCYFRGVSSPSMIWIEVLDDLSEDWIASSIIQKHYESDSKILAHEYAL